MARPPPATLTRLTTALLISSWPLLSLLATVVWPYPLAHLSIMRVGVLTSNGVALVVALEGEKGVLTGRRAAVVILAAEGLRRAAGVALARVWVG